MWRRSRAGGSGMSRGACARRGRRTSAGSSPRARSPRATRSGRRRRTSGAPRSRSDQRSGRAPRSPGARAPPRARRSSRRRSLRQSRARAGCGRRRAWSCAAASRMSVHGPLTLPLVPETETPTKPQAVEGSNGLLIEVDGQIVPNYDATIVPFSEGDVVTGKVVRIDKDEVLVDIGYKSEGVIPAGELSIRKSANPHDEVAMGDEVDALVLTKEDQDGRLVLSKKRARFEKAWRRIEAAAESGEPVEGTVIEVVKGGLIIDLGVRGFLPASLVDIRRVQNLDDFLGQTIESKVIELNRSRNNVVLSRRAVLEEERKEVRQQILDRLQPGQIVEGAISNIVDFGAFVEVLDGVEGLVHISELAPHHVENPREVVSQGDVIRVKILEIDSDRRRLSLSAKRVEDQVLPVSGSSAGGGQEAEGGDGAIGEVRDLDLSDEVFTGADEAPSEAGAGDAEGDGESQPAAEGQAEPEPEPA